MLSRLKNIPVLRIHVLFWTMFIFFGVVFNVALHNQMRVTFPLLWSDLVDPLTPIGYARTILMCYLSLWTFDRLLRRHQYGLAIVVLLTLIALDVLLRYAIEQLFLGPVFGVWQYPAELRIWAYFGETVFFSALGIFLCFLLKTINDFFHHEALRHEKVTMELAYLKAQLNPHFLFNTMNNLYGLSLTEPARTPDVILRLGEMMRYMLYESNETFVPLTREVEYVNGFIELEKLRYSRQTNIDFTVEGNINGVMVAPLLLISFVENAFKHGQLHEAQLPVRIRLSVSQDILYFETQNQVALREHDGSNGIGLKNVWRRLSLLYPDKHILRIWQEQDTYHVRLEINVKQTN